MYPPGSAAASGGSMRYSMLNRSARYLLMQSLLLASAFAVSGCSSREVRPVESETGEKASESVYEDILPEPESASEEVTEKWTETEFLSESTESETEAPRPLNLETLRRQLQQLRLRWGDEATFAWSFPGQFSIREPLPENVFTDFPLASFYTIPGLEVSPPENSMQILRASLLNMLSSFDGDWSVYVKNLNTGETMSINDTAMPSASIMKLFVMGTVYRAIETGELQRTDHLMSLMTDMISYSSNEDANALLSILGDGSYAAGIARVNEYIRSEGYSEKTHQYNGFQNEATVVDPDHFNHLCASDCGMMIEKIYHRTFGTRKVCNEIESMMLNQQTRYKIPAAIGDRAQVGNKTGETDDTENDVAIVYTSTCDYIICVLSSHWESKDQAQHRIQSVSSEVFSYFTDPDYVTKHFRYSKELNPRVLLAADPEEETEYAFEEMTEAEGSLLSAEENETEDATEEITGKITEGISGAMSENASESITEAMSEDESESLTEAESETEDTAGIHLRGLALGASAADTNAADPLEINIRSGSRPAGKSEKP